MNGKKNMISKCRKFIMAGLLLLTIGCLIPIWQAHYAFIRHKTQQRELRQSSQVKDPVREATSEDLVAMESASVQLSTVSVESIIPSDEPVIISENPVLLEQYQDIHLKNNDFVGWISIEGTAMDYPVVQCADDEYYLSHNFYGQEDKYGCLYVKHIADVVNGTNFIIYGHNMKDGSMFGSLDEYREEEFYREHNLISFDTLYEERTYKIMAVFLSQVYEKDAEFFKYYQFYEAENQEEFDTFYENVKELSLYNTGITAEYGDTFLTLSTCAYHVKNGRLVIVAKRI